MNKAIRKIGASLACTAVLAVPVDVVAGQLADRNSSAESAIPVISPSLLAVAKIIKGMSVVSQHDSYETTTKLIGGGVLKLRAAYTANQLSEIDIDQQNRTAPFAMQYLIAASGVTFICRDNTATVEVFDPNRGVEIDGTVYSSHAADLAAAESDEIENASIIAQATSTYLAVHPNQLAYSYPNMCEIPLG
jgi:hypothetical protein